MYKGRILVIDDEINILRTIELSLTSSGYTTETFSKPEEGITRAREIYFDLAFIDLKMQPLSGLEVLFEIKKISPETTVVLMTAHGTIESAVEAMKNGAYDYILKPFTHKEFTYIVDRVFNHHKMSKKIVGLTYQLDQMNERETFVTVNSAVREILNTALEIADSNIPILIEGRAVRERRYCHGLSMKTAKERRTLYNHKLFGNSGKSF